MVWFKGNSVSKYYFKSSTTILGKQYYNPVRLHSLHALHCLTRLYQQSLLSRQRWHNHNFNIIKIMSPSWGALILHVFQKPQRMSVKLQQYGNNLTSGKQSLFYLFATLATFPPLSQYSLVLSTCLLLTEIHSATPTQISCQNWEIWILDAICYRYQSHS